MKAGVERREGGFNGPHRKVFERIKERVARAIPVWVGDQEFHKRLWASFFEKE